MAEVWREVVARGLDALAPWMDSPPVALSDPSNRHRVVETDPVSTFGEEWMGLTSLGVFIPSPGTEVNVKVLCTVGAPGECAITLNGRLLPETVRAFSASDATKWEWGTAWDRGHHSLVLVGRKGAIVGNRVIEVEVK